jgi:hypothetical protein
VACHQIKLRVNVYSHAFPHVCIAMLRLLLRLAHRLSRVQGPDSPVFQATMAESTSRVMLSGMQPGGFWPAFVELPPAGPECDEGDAEDSDVDDGDDGEPSDPVEEMKRPAARGAKKRPAASKSRLLRPAAAKSRLPSGELQPASPVLGDGDDAEVTSPVVPSMRRPAAKRRSLEPVAEAEGEDGEAPPNYGCGRCLMRRTGCAICKRPGYKARGPRRTRVAAEASQAD